MSSLEPIGTEQARRPSRAWDGAAETPAETRFFDLRESGYDGPIDQDGYAVTDPGTLAIFAALDRATQRQMRHQQSQATAGDGSDLARWTPDLIDADGDEF